MSRIARLSHRMRFLIAPALLALTLALGAASASAAPVGFQATGGWYTDDDNFFLGAGARFGFGTMTIIPNVEYLFVDNASSYSLNIDGTMSVLPFAVATGYVGAGLGWVTFDPDNGKSNTDTGINLIAGAGLNAIPLKPFAQFKYVIMDGDDPLQFAVGVRF